MEKMVTKEFLFCSIVYFSLSSENEFSFTLEILPAIVKFLIISHKFQAYYILELYELKQNIKHVWLKMIFHNFVATLSTIIFLVLRKKYCSFCCAFYFIEIWLI